MLYKFVDDKGTFIVEDPRNYNLYLPLVDQKALLLSAISANLGGDIKRDNDHFLTAPASIEDIRSNLLCRRDFFIKIGHKLIRLSRPYRDRLEAGLLYQKLIKKTAGLDIEVLNFVPYNLGVELMRVRVKNTSRREVKITPTSFIPLYARPEKNLRDHRHVSSLLNRLQLDKYGILLKPTMVFDEKKHSLNKMIYFVLGFEGSALAPVGQFPTLDYFCGRGDLISPDAVMKNIKPVKRHCSCFDGKEAAAAFRFRDRHLKRSEEVSYFLIMGMEEDREKIKRIFLKLNSPLKVEASFRETKKYWLKTLRQHPVVTERPVCRLLRQPKFIFKDRDFNNWLLWVKLQPILRKLFGCSFLPAFDYGKGGRGWRDLWQDVLTMLLIEPKKAKAVILNNFRGIRLDGSNATIITKEGNFLSDRNRINRVWMDHGVWPYLTLKLYMNKTADLGVLLKNTFYFRDSQLKRSSQIDPDFCQKDYLQRGRNGKIYQGSILEHLLVQHLVQFFNVGEHNIIRLENADWNDGLDMAPQRGESVAFSFMYAHNLAGLCVFLEGLKRKAKKVKLLKEIKLLLDSLFRPVNYNDYRARQKRLNLYFEQLNNISGKRIDIEIDGLISDLRKKSAHLAAWLRAKEWISDLGFFNGYYDNRGQRVEGLRKGRVRMMLASQVFAIFSGVATDEQVRKIWGAINKYLKDKTLGGIHLNTDFGGVYMELGRAFGFSYGDKENGAFFNHMNVMLAHALYKRGFRKEAEEVMGSIYSMCSAPLAKIYPCLPEYFNAQGQGLYLYLTGSASWFIYTLALYNHGGLE